MSLLKKLAGQAALYGLSSMLGRALNFLLVPFYTAILFPAEFGAITEMYAYVAFLNIIYLYGMETAYFRFSTKEGFNERETYNNAQTLLLFSSALFSGALILFAQPLAEILQYPEKSSYIVWLSLILGIDAIVAIPFAKLRLEKKAAFFASAKLLNIFLNIGFNIFFLVVCRDISNGEYLTEYKNTIDAFYKTGMDVEYVFISNLLANVVMIPVLWKQFFIYRLRFDLKEIGPMLKYAYPLMFMGLAGMVNEMLDRVMLKHILPENFYNGISNAEALGIYGACYKLSMFMTLAVQAFRYAADPFFFSQAKDKNAPELFSKVMKWFIIVCCFIFLFVSLNIDLFGLILRNSVYRQGLMVVPVLLLANLFLGIYYNLSVWYKLTDKTYYGTFISVGGALVTILGNMLLIPLFGYMGAAYATLFCYFSMAVASYVLGNKYYPVPYNLKSATIYIGICTLMIVCFFSASFQNSIFKYSISISIVLLFGFLVFLLEKKDFFKLRTKN